MIRRSWGRDLIKHFFSNVYRRFLALRASLRTADVFPVVASLAPKNNNNNIIGDELLLNSGAKFQR